MCGVPQMRWMHETPYLRWGFKPSVAAMKHPQRALDDVLTSDEIDGTVNSTATRVAHVLPGAIMVHV